MIPVNTKYPAFEANQVLTNENLNQMRDYLDEQTRLTRANLIGIGIVCGLDYQVEADGSAIQLFKGVGITSAGHLIAACENSKPLEFYRPYTVPDELAYPVFFPDNNADNSSYPLWELTEDLNNDPDAQPLSLDFLSGNNMPAGSDGEKVLLLFLECLAVDNRNCSPNSCDDRGQTIETTVRRLLIRREDLDEIQAQVMQLGPAAEDYFGLTGLQQLRNSLPELRMRRFDVPATGLIYSEDVLQAFQSVLTPALIGGVASALNELYQAFRPVLFQGFPSNPFTGLENQWAFLHNGGIVSQNRHQWMQYFHDHIYTVIQAYNEFRAEGLELIGLCCPDSRLFPRHLMLGPALPDAESAEYRHHFAPSPALSRYERGRSSLIMLFRRLHTLVESLELPPNVQTGPVFGNFVLTPVKITPSKLGNFPLSEKAIPYHYEPVPLNEYWNPALSRQQKANLNLGYRADSWNSTDDFVLNPLRYDHEAQNFYRIEGHIGQPYQFVLQSLISQRNNQRLPFDIVALRSGRHADAVNVPGDVMACNFHDLEAIYDSLREELLCRLCEGVQYFYNTVVRDAEGEPVFPVSAPTEMPDLMLLRECSPDYRYRNGTVAQRLEQILPELNTLPYQNLNPGGPSNWWWWNGTQAVRSIFLGDSENFEAYQWHAVFIYYMVALSRSLSESLSTLQVEAFTDRYRDLQALFNIVDDILVDQQAGGSGGNTQQVNWEEVQDQLSLVISACKLESILSLTETYQHRLEEVKERYLLTSFSRKHPGLEHRAGVPRGGTFVIVYHAVDESEDTGPGQQGNFRIRGNVNAGGEPVTGATVRAWQSSSGTVTDFDGNFSLPIFYLPVRLSISAQGFEERELQVTTEDQEYNIDLLAPPPSEEAYPNLIEGRVLADFYLPYLCCSDCQPITFQLPPAQLQVDWEQVGCTITDANGENRGEVQLSPDAGTPPYQYSLDGGLNWQDLSEEPISVREGDSLIIRDAAGTQTSPQSISLKPSLSVEMGEPSCNDETLEHTRQVLVTGGTPPYTLQINGTSFTLQEGQPENVSLPSGQGGTLIVTDSDDPACETTIEVPAEECAPSNDCDLPCDGVTRACSHLFWVQPPPPVSGGNRYTNFDISVDMLEVTDPNSPESSWTSTAEERAQLKEILNISSNQPLTRNNFNDIWSDRVEKANAYIQERLQSAFGSSVGDVFRLLYVPSENELAPDFAFLRVEAFECFNFTFVVSVNYDVTGTPIAYRRLSQYTETDLIVESLLLYEEEELDQTKTTIQPLNCTRAFRCEEGNPQEDICPQPLPPPELNIDVDPELVYVGLELPEEASRYYVECLYTVQPFESPEEALNNLEFKMLPNYPLATLHVRVLSFNSENGCLSSGSEAYQFLI